MKQLKIKIKNNFKIIKIQNFNRSNQNNNQKFKLNLLRY